MSEKDDILKKYETDVQWLKEHVAPDDIYDFAHQMRSCAMTILCECNKNFDMVSLLKKDKELNHRVKYIVQISKLQHSESDRFIDTSIEMPDEKSL